MLKSIHKSYVRFREKLKLDLNYLEVATKKNSPR